MPEEEIDLNTQQMQNLRNQIEASKKLARVLDENPGVVANSLTHLMLGGIIQGLQVLEVKINQVQQTLNKQESPRILVP